MSGHPAVEPVARYLCRDYWCGDEERWDEFVEQDRAVVGIVRSADPFTAPLAGNIEVREPRSCAQCSAQPWRPHAESCPFTEVWTP